MLFYVNVFLSITFPSLYSSIWRRITGSDLQSGTLVEIGLAYLVVSMVFGYIIHFVLLTSVIAFGVGIWGILKTVKIAITKKGAIHVTKNLNSKNQ